MLDRRSRPSRGRGARGRQRRRAAPGRLTPWWEATAPPASTSQRTSSSVDSTRPQADPPVGEVDRVARRDAPRRGPPRRPAAAPREPDRARVGGQRHARPRVQLDDVRPRARRGAASARAGRRGSRPPCRRASAASRIRSTFSACSSRGAVGEVEAEDVGAGGDQPPEALRRRASPGRPWRRSWSAGARAAPSTSSALGLGASAGSMRSARGSGRWHASPATGRPARRRSSPPRALELLDVAAAARRAAAIASPAATESSERNHCPALEQLELEEVAHRARRRGPARRARRARRPSPACSSGSRCARGPGPRSSSRMKQSPRTISVVVAAVRPSSSVPPKIAVDEEEREQRADPDRDPRRDRERRQRAQQPAAVERPLARRQREHERGDADRQDRRQRSGGGAGTGR